MARGMENKRKSKGQGTAEHPFCHEDSNSPIPALHVCSEGGQRRPDLPHSGQRLICCPTRHGMCIPRSHKKPATQACEHPSEHSKSGRVLPSSYHLDGSPKVSKDPLLRPYTFPSDLGTIRFPHQKAVWSLDLVSITTDLEVTWRETMSSPESLFHQVFKINLL